MTIYEIVTPPLYGTATISGETVVYDPDTDYTGDDSFVYRAIVDGLVQKERNVCLTIVP